MLKHRMSGKLLLSIAILTTLVNTATASCSYSRISGYQSSYTFNYQLNVCQTSTDAVQSSVVFPNDYRVGGVPAQCAPSNGVNSYQCTSGSGSINFGLYTPNNPNGHPQITVSVGGETCSEVNYCPSIDSNQGGGNKDDGTLSLGPFGTYPKTAAIIGLTVFSCLLLGVIYLIYRRHRTYTSRVTDEPGPRRNLWQIIFGSTHRETGSRYGKSKKNNATTTTTRNIGPKRKGNLEEGNKDLEANSLPLVNVSVNELGSGVKNVPKSSVLVNLDDTVQKPMPTRTRSTVHRETSIKQKDRNREEQPSGAPTRSRTVKRGQTISEKSHDIKPSEEQVEDNRGRSRTTAALDKSQSSTAHVSRSKTTKDNVRFKEQNREVKRSVTSKRDERKLRNEATESGDASLSRNRSIKSSRSNDSDNTPLKIHRSKTIGATLQKADDGASLDTKDSTPLGLIQRNKSLNTSKKPTARATTSRQPAVPDDDDDVPLLRTSSPSKVQTTQSNTTPHDGNRDSTLPEVRSTNSHYSEDIFDLYEDNKH